MKMRMGFVTNSSSSSFLVQFKNKTELNEFIEEIQREVGEFAANEIRERIQNNIVGKREALKFVAEDMSIYRLAHILGIDDYWRHYTFREMRDTKSGIGKKIDTVRKAEVKRVSERLNANYIIAHINVSDDYLEMAKLEHTILPEHKNTVYYENHH